MNSLSTYEMGKLEIYIEYDEFWIYFQELGYVQPAIFAASVMT